MSNKSLKDKGGIPDVCRPMSRVSKRIKPNITVMQCKDLFFLYVSISIVDSLDILLLTRKMLSAVAFSWKWNTLALLAPKPNAIKWVLPTLSVMVAPHQKRRKQKTKTFVAYLCGCYQSLQAVRERGKGHFFCSNLFANDRAIRFNDRAIWYNDRVIWFNDGVIWFSDRTIQFSDQALQSLYSD